MKSLPFVASLLWSFSHLSSALGSPPDPTSLKFTKWTPHFLVPDPVAISFDDQGRAYVTQTQRRKANDLDIRNNRDWITNDLSFQSPDDKRAFYRQQFTSENSSQNKRRVQDYNKDGKHDLEDLKALSEKIHLIEDTDQDGTADQLSTFAEGFQNEIAGIAAGVLFHEGDVYTTIVPDVWKLRDTNHDGKADQRESIAYGFGVHLAYAGHDMHGLTVGPDGRIYWTVGDKGVGATSKEGIHFKYPNQGALLRCEPDGSSLEVYARGLRNVQEIAFDQFGNLFGVDNDSDRPGEKERFVYLVEHMDAGWRSHWQYRASEYNPWMDERLSVPYHQGQPAYILPPISLYQNGPAGMAYNPGTALSVEWKDYFFHTSAPNGQQWAFQVKEDGASFQMINEMQIGNGVPIVGINFGPDGALYGVDWGGGYPLNQKGAVWKWDVENPHPLRKKTQAILRKVFSKCENSTLIEFLNYPDQRVRLKAQFELARRSERVLLKKAAQSGPQLARIHAIWGLGQIERAQKNKAYDLLGLLKDPDPEIRVQVLKTYSESFVSKLSVHQAPSPIPNPSPFVEIIHCLSDPSERVRFYATMALGNLGVTEGKDELIKMARDLNDSSKTYLRHALTVGLTGSASTEFLANLSEDQSEFVQTIAILALRRRGASEISAFLDSPFESVVTEAARAIHDDWTIPEAMPQLASILNSTKWHSNESLIRRVINANFRLGTSHHARRVAQFAALSKTSEILRLEALDALKKWAKPDPLDRVTGRHRPLPVRDLHRAQSAVEAQLTNLFSLPGESIQSAALALSQALQIKLSNESLATLALNEKTNPNVRIESLKALFAQDQKEVRPILTQSLAAESSEVRIAALELIFRVDQAEANRVISRLLNHPKTPIHEKQIALHLISGSFASKETDELLKHQLGRFSQIPPELKLDLLEAATARKIDAPAPKYLYTLKGGDQQRGENLFRNHLSAQCVRCHETGQGNGSDIGPNLESVGRKGREYLLESLLEPQKVIAQGYGAISLTLKSGESVAGILEREEENGIVIKDSKGNTQTIKTSMIRERSPVISTMPPMGAILNKHEIRDIIEYLSSLQKKPQ